MGYRKLHGVFTSIWIQFSCIYLANGQMGIPVSPGNNTFEMGLLDPFSQADPLATSVTTNEPPSVYSMQYVTTRQDMNFVIGSSTNPTHPLPDNSVVPSTTANAETKTSSGTSRVEGRSVSDQSTVADASSTYTDSPTGVSVSPKGLGVESSTAGRQPITGSPLSLFNFEESAVIRNIDPVSGHSISPNIDTNIKGEGTLNLIVKSNTNDVPLERPPIFPDSNKITDKPIVFPQRARDSTSVDSHITTNKVNSNQQVESIADKSSEKAPTWVVSNKDSTFVIISTASPNVERTPIVEGTVILDKSAVMSERNADSFEKGKVPSLFEIDIATKGNKATNSLAMEARPSLMTDFLNHSPNEMEKNTAIIELQNGVKTIDLKSSPFSIKSRGTNGSNTLNNHPREISTLAQEEKTKLLAGSSAKTPFKWDQILSMLTQGNLSQETLIISGGVKTADNIRVDDTQSKVSSNEIGFQVGSPRDFRSLNPAGEPDPMHSGLVLIPDAIEQARRAGGMQISGFPVDLQPDTFSSRQGTTSSVKSSLTGKQQIASDVAGAMLFESLGLPRQQTVNAGGMSIDLASMQDNIVPEMGMFGGLGISQGGSAPEAGGLNMLLTSGQRGISGPSLADNIPPPPPTNHCDYYKENSEDIRFYYVRDSTGWITQRCALGTGFDKRSCQCSVFLTARPEGCKSELSLNFNNGQVQDVSGNRIPVGIHKINVDKDGQHAILGGDGRIVLWRYTNYDFMNHLIIKLSFNPDVDGTGLQTIFGNCDLITGDPSIGAVINSDKKQVSFALKIRELKPKFITFPITPGQWHRVEYRYDATTFSVTINGARKEVPVEGYIKIESAPLVLGYCEKFGSYKGKLDEFEIYTCIPEVTNV
ncbi:hypothetical protein CHS0354_023329 [Potamilus streckersoni]|uniref:Uncharacterized protein n=1 Tax=Potamilus streckersoni TaxID=2493646 RepID=A0AAE0T506_9BIVA|nr:hypothetical protein CHS0354_023329 [Potamilus streckersoni]